MDTTRIVIPLILLTTAAASGRGLIGPDVVCWIAADGHAFYGSVDGIGGYSTGTTSCNWGDIPAAWYGGTTETPLIAQNAYRLHDGRFEQIGMSWLKHSFCALSQSGCGECQSTDCDTLGIGCADTYGAGLNSHGSGPRSVVNAVTGAYPYPFGLSNSGPSAIRGNLQIKDIDMEPSLNQGARYFIEGQYVCPDEAEYGTQFNNASWREVLVQNVGAMTNLGDTVPAEAAIKAWKQIDPDVVETEHLIPGDGLVILSAKALDLGNGYHRYEYACWNQNSDRSIGQFMLPLPSGASVANIGFHDVDYHSGEVIDSTDWNWEVTEDAITWSTQTFEENEWANAIRWGSLYNFRVDVSAEPMEGAVLLGLFKPGPDPDQYLSTIVPMGALIDPCNLPLESCATDIDEDGTVNVNDLLAAIAEWDTCGDGTFRPAADVDDDCCVNIHDLLTVLSDWGDCIPPPQCWFVRACCLPDGSCEGMDAGSTEYCESLGGISYPINNCCADITCPPVGACCNRAAGTCQDDFEHACNVKPDPTGEIVWLGAGSHCLDPAVCASGACCIHGEIWACAHMSEWTCEQFSGVFHGANTTCKHVSCGQSEHNDDCQDSWSISDGLWDFQTLTATTDGPQHPECKYKGQTFNDIWFHYVAPASGTLVVSTCDLADYDTDLVLYEGWNCYDFTMINCSEDAPGCGGYTSHMESPVIGGQQYMIRVGGWESGDSGTGQLLVDLLD